MVWVWVGRTEPAARVARSEPRKILFVIKHLEKNIHQKNNWKLTTQPALFCEREGVGRPSRFTSSAKFDLKNAKLVPPDLCEFVKEQGFPNILGNKHMSIRDLTSN